MGAPGRSVSSRRGAAHPIGILSPASGRQGGVLRARLRASAGCLESAPVVTSMGLRSQPRRSRISGRTANGEPACRHRSTKRTGEPVFPHPIPRCSYQ